jgi:hypothetical protein
MRLREYGIALLLVSLPGCGSGDSAAPLEDGGDLDVRRADVGAEDTNAAVDAPPDVPYPAPHASLPQVVTANGPVLKAPKIVATGFSGDPNLPTLRGFVESLAAGAAYWSEATSQYGVGPIASGTLTTLDEKAPSTIDDSQIQSWLAAQFGGGADAGALPPPDLETMYVILYPAATTVTSASGTNCRDFDGYHSEFSYGGGRVTYAVVTACPIPGLTEQDSITAIASHELAEAATDPLPGDRPAWVGTTPIGVAWQFLGPGGEIGDMCEQFTDSFYTPSGFPYAVQRVWSNRDALASHDPCQPDGKSPYFNTAPALPDEITASLPQAFVASTTPGIKIPVGQSRTVELDLFSDAPMPAWNVGAVDLGYALYGKPLLSFSFDTITGQNGDVIHLTITVLAAGPGGAEPFWIQSNSSSATTYWPAVVGQQ